MHGGQRCGDATGLVCWKSEAEGDLLFVTVDQFEKKHVRTHIIAVQLLLKSVYELKTNGCHDNFVAARKMLSVREMVKEGERQGETERARSSFIPCSMVGIIHRVTGKDKHLRAAADGYQKGYMCTPFLDFHCVVRLS